MGWDLGLGMVAGWLTGWLARGWHTRWVWSGQDSRFLGLCRLFCHVVCFLLVVLGPVSFVMLRKGVAKKGGFFSLILMAPPSSS